MIPFVKQNIEKNYKNQFLHISENNLILVKCQISTLESRPIFFGITRKIKITRILLSSFSFSSRFYWKYNVMNIYRKNSQLYFYGLLIFHANYGSKYYNSNFGEKNTIIKIKQIYIRIKYILKKQYNIHF